MTQARRQQIDESVTPWYHCISRCVRGSRLMGGEFAHRQQWLEERIQFLTEIMGIECLAFGILDNHVHLLLRLDSELVNSWDEREVAERWARLFPPTALKSDCPQAWEEWVTTHAADADWVATSRESLASISCFHKCLKEPLARLANKEEGVTGAFWNGRFRSIAILDESALLTTAAYIDLNPVAAGIADTPEDSPHTSFHARVEHCRNLGELEQVQDGLSTETSQTEMEQQHWLLPIEDRRAQGEAVIGMLSGFTFSCYARLVDWASRLIREGKAHIDACVASIFERLQLDAEQWQSSLQLLLTSKKLVGCYFGCRSRLYEVAQRLGKRWVKNVGTQAAAVGA